MLGKTVALVSLGLLLPRMPAAQTTGIADVIGPGRLDRDAITMPKRLLLTGKVVLEEGSPLPEPINVELACGGSVRQETFTYGEEGDFTFELGGGSETMDASGSGNRPNLDPSSRVPTIAAEERTLDLSGCLIQAALPGFRAESIPLGVRTYLDSSDVGMIVLRRLKNVGGSTVSLTTLAAPKNARKYYDSAYQELQKQKGDVPKAMQDLEQAVQLHPEFAAAWFLLGRGHHALRNREPARKCFRKAAEADPTYLRPFMFLAMMGVGDEDWQEVARNCDHIIELNPHVTRAHFYHAVANLNLGNLDLAWESIKMVRESGSKRYLFGLHYVRGAILTKRGDFRGAAQEFRRFIALKPEDKTSKQLEQKLLAWEKHGLIKGVEPLQAIQNQ